MVLNDFVVRPIMRHVYYKLRLYGYFAAGMGVGAVGGKFLASGVLSQTSQYIQVARSFLHL